MIGLKKGLAVAAVAALPLALWAQAGGSPGTPPQQAHQHRHGMEGQGMGMGMGGKGMMKDMEGHQGRMHGGMQGMQGMRGMHGQGGMQGGCHEEGAKPAG